MARLEEKIVRQQEVLYNVDFQLVAMERRVARAAGQRTQDETEALNARIAALTQVGLVGGDGAHCGQWQQIVV